MSFLPGFERPSWAPGQPCGREDIWIIEADLRTAGYHAIAGVDEAGRGPLCGPVVAGAVIMPEGCRPPIIDDSKRLTANQREAAYSWLRRHVVFAVALAHPWEIDRYNILEATRMAMVRAIKKLSTQPDCLVLDAVTLPQLPQFPQWPLIKGDQRCAAIAAASIFAKVIRDRLMCAYHKRYPQYGLNIHKGYPTAKHRAILQSLGPSPIHRKTFKGVREFAMQDKSPNTPSMPSITTGQMG